ncbi:hypothetical protein N9005_05530 [Akkermansiaceae bacterium]|nr:hypothetical protein [Akkermansiaceae bacterium]
MKRLVVDIDLTITIAGEQEYHDKIPNLEVVEKLRNYKKKGFEIILFTSRNMKTYKSDLSKINRFTLPVIIDWLDKNNVPYDGILMGKPWCGTEGFYVDDKAIRPSEFTDLSYEQILKLIK